MSVAMLEASEETTEFDLDIRVEAGEVPAHEGAAIPTYSACWITQGC